MQQAQFLKWFVIEKRRTLRIEYQPDETGKLVPQPRRQKISFLVGRKALNALYRKKVMFPFCPLHNKELVEGMFQLAYLITPKPSNVRILPLKEVDGLNPLLLRRTREARKQGLIPKDRKKRELDPLTQCACSWRRGSIRLGARLLFIMYGPLEWWGVKGVVFWGSGPLTPCRGGSIHSISIGIWSLTELLVFLRVPALLGDAYPLPAILFNALLPAPVPLLALFGSLSGSGAGSTPLKP